MSNEDIKAAAALDDTLTALWSQLGAVGGAIAAAVAPMLLQLAGQIQAVASIVIGWVRDNRELVTSIFIAAAALTVIGGIAVGIGTAFVALGAVIGGVATVFGLIGSILGAILSPIGLIVAALVGIGVWFVTASETGAAAVEGLRSVFGSLGADAMATFEAIKTALASGDFEGAARVAWSAIQLAWTAGTVGLRSIWSDFTRWMLSAYLDVIEGIQTAFTSMVQQQTAFMSGIASALIPGGGGKIVAAADAFNKGLDKSLAADNAARDMVRGGLATDAKDPDVAKAEADYEAARAAWQNAVAEVKTTPATDAAAVTAAGGGGLGNVGGSAAVASVGTFSNLAGRALAGPDSAVVSALNQQTELLQQIADNTTEEAG